MSSKYGWIITKDHLAEDMGSIDFPPRDDTNVLGPRDITPRLRRDLLSPEKCENFRMYDDDGELYYEGRITGDYEGFEPLDDFGTPNAGCTHIKYPGKAPDSWEVL